MTLYAITPRAASRAANPHHGRRHRANFARAAVFAEFGRHGWALDHGDFLDRMPWQMPRRAPGARF